MNQDEPDFNPNDFEILHEVNAAEAWIELGNPNEAQKSLDQISKDIRDGYPALIREIELQILELKGQWGEVLKMATETIREFPSSSIAHTLRIKALEKLGRTDAVAPAKSESFEILFREAMGMIDGNYRYTAVQCVKAAMEMKPESKEWIKDMPQLKKLLEEFE